MSVQNYVKIPKDIAGIKQKFMFGLTKRQCVCFGIGLAMGLPAFYLAFNFIGLQAGCFALAIFAAPGLLCGMYSKNGLHLEQIVRLMVEFFKKPKERTYQSENVFDALTRQMEYVDLKKKLKSAGAGTSEKRKR